MFHYRWYFNEDADNAKKMLVLQHKIDIDDESMNQFGDIIADSKLIGYGLLVQMMIQQNSLIKVIKDIYH